MVKKFSASDFLYEAGPSVSKFQSNEVIECRFIVPCPLEIPFGDHYLTQSFDKRVS